MRIISGNSNPLLAKEISFELKEKNIDVTVTKFADQEVFVEINENVRGKNIFIFNQRLCPLMTI